MKTPPEKTVQIQVSFSDRSLARTVLEDLRRDRTLALNILRGRITEEEASFVLEVSGTVRNIEHFLRWSATWDAAVGGLPVGVA